MQEPIKISVILPSYNVEDYLEACLNSIWLQRYSNLEILIVNDCSTDGTLKLAQCLAQEEKRIKVINNLENQKLSESRNIGLRAATGDYIHFVDADDLVQEGSYHAVTQTILNNLLPNPIDFCVTPRGITTGSLSETSKQTFGPQLLKKIYYSGPREILKVSSKKRFQKSSMHVGTKLWRREFLLSHNLWFAKGLLFEDVDYYWRTLAAAKAIALCDQGLYYYRRSRSGSIMDEVCTPEGLKQNLDTCSIAEFTYERLLKMENGRLFIPQFIGKTLKTYIAAYNRFIKFEKERMFFDRMQQSLKKLNFSTADMPPFRRVRLKLLKDAPFSLVKWLFKYRIIRLIK